MEREDYYKAQIIKAIIFVNTRFIGGNPLTLNHVYLTSDQLMQMSRTILIELQSISLLSFWGTLGGNSKNPCGSTK
jgi:hypothetical protein